VARRHRKRKSTAARWWRPNVWLTTLGTIVAVATGMFTLRDQIFPSDSGRAVASPAGYQQSVGIVCDALNGADSARVADARNLNRQLRKARTTLAQRNAVLAGWNRVLARSQHELGVFEGFDVPNGVLTQERATAAAWSRIVTLLENFTQRLDSVGNEAGLVAAVKTLPAMRTALAADGIAQTAGLTDLGGPYCRLNTPSSIPPITLPRLQQPVNAAPRRTGRSQRPRTPTDFKPRVVAVVTPPVGPTLAPSSIGSASPQPPIAPTVAPETTAPPPGMTDQPRSSTTSPAPAPH
jgi:hypothetical protein